MKLGDYQWRGFPLVAYLCHGQVVLCCGLLCHVWDQKEFDGALALGALTRIL